MTIDELTDRIRRTLDRDGQYPGTWDDTDRIARTIAIDIDREESADITVLTFPSGSKGVGHPVQLNGYTLYLERIDGTEMLSLPVDWDGNITRDKLPQLLAVLNHIERNNIHLDERTATDEQ